MPHVLLYWVAFLKNGSGESSHPDDGFLDQNQIFIVSGRRCVDAWGNVLYQHTHIMKGVIPNSKMVMQNMWSGNTEWYRTANLHPYLPQPHYSQKLQGEMNKLKHNLSLLELYCKQSFCQTHSSDPCCRSGSYYDPQQSECDFIWRVKLQ